MPSPVRRRRIGAAPRGADGDAAAVGRCADAARRRSPRSRPAAARRSPTPADAGRRRREAPAPRRAGAAAARRRSRRSSAGCSAATRSSRPASASSSSASPSSPSTRASTPTCRSSAGSAAIGAAAVVLLGFGWRLRLSRPDYAQVLQGGAVAVLYLTLFAAFRFYGVLARGPAFVLMVAVAALAAALAVLQDARALAVIGALGGFATPLIVSTGSDNHVALFAYYFVLDLGIAAVAWSKTWRSLNLIGFVATFVVATAWGVLKYRPEDFATSQAFLIAFFLLFVVIMLLPARRPRARAGAGAPRRTRRLGQQQPAVRPADDHLRAAVRPGPRHAVRRRARRRSCSAGFYVAARDVDEAAPRARHHLRRQPGDRDRLPHARHPVRARRAQHRRRLDARGRGPGLDRLSPAARPAARFRLRCCSSLAGAGDAARPRAPRRADRDLQRLPLQRPDGRRGVARRRVLRPSRRRAPAR